MATETTNFRLVKPDRTDFVDIPAHLNANLDMIDQLINERIEKALIAHNLTTTDINMVLGADVGPAIQQELNNKASKAEIPSIPTSLPANGGHADTADRLKNARTIALSGSITCTATSFDGSTDIIIPVTTINPDNLSKATPINKGGTGATTKSDARTNLGIFVQESAPSSPSNGDIWIW